MGVIGISEPTTLVVEGLLLEDIGDAVVIMVVDVGSVVCCAGDTIVLASVVNVGTVVSLVEENPGVLEAGEFLAIC